MPFMFRKRLLSLVIPVLVVGALSASCSDDDDGPTPTGTSPRTTSQQGGDGTTSGVRRLDIVGFTFDSSSITLTVTNSGTVRTAGSASCVVDHASGALAPGMLLPVLDPGETATETYTDLWASDVVPIQVRDCQVTSVG
jgi:hypothetical protein